MLQSRFSGRREVSGQRRQRWPTENIDQRSAYHHPNKISAGNAQELDYESGGGRAKIQSAKVGQMSFAQELMSAFRRAFTLLWHVVKQSKNPWYYWYTGSKIVAIQAWLVSFCTMFAVAAFASSGGLFVTLIYILLGVALESIAIVIILVALIADHYLPIPDQSYSKLLLPVLVSAFFAFVLNRLSVFTILHFRSKPLG
jgi:hypothetical protein